MKECIILAGGFGTRLQSVVKDVPKCMAKVAKRPFLYYIFEYLSNQKIDHVILSLGYKAEYIIKWLNDVSYSFKVSYVIESEPLGTGGAIKYAMSKTTTDSVYVINGDTFFDVNLFSFSNFHLNNKADISLCLKHLKHFDRYGSVEINKDNEILKFNEKQFCEEGLINGGVYLIKKTYIDELDLPQKFSFEKDIMENQSLNTHIYGYISDSYFIDIGIPEDFEKANTDFLNFKHD